MGRRARREQASAGERGTAHREWAVGQGGIDFAWAATALHTGEIFRAAGFKPELTPQQFTFHLGVSLVRALTLRMTVADRDVGQRRALLVLETAPGSPVVSQERYEVSMDAQGRVLLSLDSQARPGGGIRAAGWPVMSGVLTLAHRRLGHAMTAIVEGRPTRDN